MKRAVRSLLPLIILLALNSSSLWAQQQQTREGVWVGVGFGYGSLDAACDECGDFSHEEGVTAHFRIGGTLSPKVLLGFESDGWVTVARRREFGTVMLANNMSATVYYYPSTTGNFFVKGGVGSSFYHDEFFGVGTSVTGFGMVLGLGYDFRVARNISITPLGNLRFGGGGDLETENGTLRNFGHSVVSLDLGVTFH